MKSNIKRRPLGNTGLKVSEVSLGAMNLRLLNTSKEGEELVRHALSLGINMIDTARGYNGKAPDGTLIESEVIIGKVISEIKLDEPVVIVTKGHGYNREDFDSELKESRKKLGIKGRHKLMIGKNEIKLIYFFHGINEERWLEMKNTGAIDLARKRQDEGLFNYLGFSSHNGHERVIRRAILSGFFQVLELPYNVFNPELGKYTKRSANLLKLAYDQGLGVINMKALGGNGMVSKTRIFESYCDISAEKRLAYCLSYPYISTVDTGCRYVNELDANEKVSQNGAIKRPERISLEKTAAKVSEITEGTCRECTHCLEKFTCPKGIDFTGILSLHTRYKLANAFKGNITEIKDKYKKIQKKADKCEKCELCSKWCEYRLDIPKLLDETHNFLG